LGGFWLFDKRPKRRRKKGKKKKLESGIRGKNNGQKKLATLKATRNREKGI